MLEHSFPAGRVRIEILAKPDRGEGNTGSVQERAADGVQALSLGGRDPSPGAMGHEGQLPQARGGILRKTAVPPVKLPCVEPAQQALCSSQGIDGKGSREGRYAGVRFVEHAEEGAHPLDVREGFAGQAGVELEEPEQAAGADTEFPEPVPALAGRPVEAEAEGDLDLHREGRLNIVHTVSHATAISQNCLRTSPRPTRLANVRKSFLACWMRPATIAG